MDKLAAREMMKTSGDMRLKLKLAKSIVDANENVPSSIEIPGDSDGRTLAERIGGLLKLDPDCLRLISGGRVMKEFVPLRDQGVRPGAVVMVVMINKEDDSLKVLDEQRKMLENTRNDAELLGDDEYGQGLQVAGTFGKTITRKFLVNE